MILLLIMTILIAPLHALSQAMGGPSGPSYYGQGALINLVQINVNSYNPLSANWTSQNVSDTFVNQDLSINATLPFLTSLTNKTTGITPIAFAAKHWAIHETESPVSVRFEGRGIQAEWYIKGFQLQSMHLPHGLMACNLSTTQQRVYPKSGSEPATGDCEDITLFAYYVRGSATPFDCGDPEAPCL